MAEESKITPASPQTDKALNIKDPSNVDDTAIYHYDPSSAEFTLKQYVTFTQDTKSPTNPAKFPSANNFAPTTSPFILEIQGTGFNTSTQSGEPLKVWAQLGDYLALVPPLSSSTDLSIGNAFGYVIKSADKLWIYFSRLVFQKIWFKYDVKTFRGIEDTNKQQLESGNSVYPFLNKSTQLTIYAAVNNGHIVEKPYYFSESTNPGFKKLESINLTQSPFIITLQGNFLNGATYPIVTDGSEVIRLFGHNLKAGDTIHPMMVKTSSTLLKTNPSALPQNVLSDNQNDAAVQNLTAQQLATLEYFKVGHFLSDIDEFAPKPEQKPKGYFYRAPDGTLANTGKTGGLPADKLSIVQFSIKTLPAGAYYVVVYDSQTGDYDVAPIIITISLASGKIQIHDVTPDTVVLQSPSFTVNGFNFPLPSDIANGAIFTVSLVSSDQTNAVVGHAVNALFGPTAFLQIDSTSPTNSKNGNGTITLTSDSQFTAKFTNLHVTADQLASLGTSVTFKIYIEVTYQNPNPAKGKVNEAALSATNIQVQKQPVIHFLTNTTNPLPLLAANVYPQSLVRVDQATGKVIAFGVPEDNLYIVGENFNTGGAVTVLIKGNQQQVIELLSWPLNPTFNAIKIKVDPSNIKGDATVEVRVGSASSEAFQYIKSLSTLIRTKDAKGLHTKGEQTLSGENAAFFRDILPYNQLDQTTLLNSTNTKVASSVQLTLSNQQTKQSVNLPADLNTSVALPFLPDQITIPANTPLSSGGTLDVTFYFYNLYNINVSTPKIYRLQHSDGSFGGVFQPNEQMTVVGTGFVDGMRYNINDTGWTPAGKLGILLINETLFQTFNLIVPASSGSNDATLKISNDQAQKVQNAATAGKLSGGYNNKSIIVNDKYSPLLKINQRLPAGIKMYAKGTQNTMTDKIDANMSIYGQITPFLGSFKTLLIVIRIIVCIIDVICALINPFQLIVAIIALMDCIIDLLSLFPQLAVPIMILSFLQNFIGFLQTFITQIETYVFSIVNSQLALVKSQTSQDIALLAAAEQQAFGATKQIRDVISFLEPAMQIVQIFKDLLNFAMHFPCAGNQGGTQNNGKCPPPNISKMINSADDQTDVEGVLEDLIGKVPLTPFPDDGGSSPSSTLSTMFCQAVAIQTETLKTMPGFNGLDSFGNPLPGGPLTPGSTSIVPTLTPVLPNIAAAIECMNNFTDQIDAALNAGQTFIKTEAQGQQLIAAYTQCVQNLIDQTNQSLGDICVLAISALNSELKVSPKGRIGPNQSDDFIRTKIALPTTQPNDQQDAGLSLDLAKFKTLPDMQVAISSNPTRTLEINSSLTTLQQQLQQITSEINNAVLFAQDSHALPNLVIANGVNQVSNGDFETGNLNAWILGAGPAPTVTTSTVRSGIYAAQVGNTTAYTGTSSMYQYITIPSTGTTVLSFWYKLFGTDVIANDWYQAQIRDTGQVTLIADLFAQQAGDHAGVGLNSIYYTTTTANWTNIIMDMTQYAGQTLTLFFAAHDDGGSFPSYMVLDDIGVFNSGSQGQVDQLLAQKATIQQQISTLSLEQTALTNNTANTLDLGLKTDIYTPVIIQTTNKSGQRQGTDKIYFDAENSDVGDLIVPGDILEIVGSPFNGLQFPILSVQKIFTAVRLTAKLDITPEQKLLVGEQAIPHNLANFNVKIIAHLAGNDAVAVVPADDASLATVQILARDHHGHEIGAGLANKVAIKIESGTAVFVPVIPSSTTDVTGVIQEQGTHYIANLKSNCAGTVIVSSSVCGIEFIDMGYHANDPNHVITTRKKTVKIIFTPPLPKPTPSAFEAIEIPQVPGTELVN